MSSPQTQAIPQTSFLDCVRHHFAKLARWAVWTCVALLLFLSSAALLILGLIVAWSVDHLRRALGFASPEQGVDWLLLLILLSGPLFLVVLLLKLATWYRGMWESRLKMVWRDPQERDDYSRLLPLSQDATNSERAARMSYLKRLLRTDPWKAEWRQMQSSHSKEGVSFPCDLEPITLKNEDYETVAEAVLVTVERDIRKRAFAAGFVVGMSQSRLFDAVAIVIASFEIQMHVLARLGKRPNLQTWNLLIERCAASLLLNTYLNREDALMLNLTIKKVGMGLQAAGELVDQAAGQITDIDLDDVDLDDELASFSGDFSSAAKMTFETTTTIAGAGMTVGAVGLQQLGRVLDKTGDDLFQGVMAGGIVYYHGMALAADTLALDSKHRSTETMNRSFAMVAKSYAIEAGRWLRDHLRGRRVAIREKRREQLSKVKDLPGQAFEKMKSLFSWRRGKGEGSPAVNAPKPKP
jgi:hypothetical protein